MVRAMWRSVELSINTSRAAADVLEVPLALLVSSVEKPDVCDFPVFECGRHEDGDDCLEIRPEDVPVGDTTEERRKRHNPELCRFNKVLFVDKPKLGNKQQSKFERMLGMKYTCSGIGEVQLMVGVRKRDKTKIQYCITALTPILR